MKYLRTATCSERGARKSNEDALAWGHGRNGYYAVLADGAGGHQRGAEAAALAVDCINRLLGDDAVAFSATNLSQTVHLANSALLHRQDARNPDARMHCTVVALWVEPALELGLWTHVGDSRLYRLRQGQVDVVTADDSVVQRMLQAGLITEEQSRNHPQKNQLVAALGMEGSIEPHTVARPVEVLAGDVFLLCTDGWWEAFDTAALQQSLARAIDPDQWLADMRQHVLARRKPRQDNFSAIAVWIGDPAKTACPDDDDTMPKANGAARPLT